MVDDLIRFGVIGAGRIGKIHTENLASRVPGAEVIAIADVRLDEAREIAQKWKIPQVTADYQEVLSNPSVDAVAICSSTDTHAKLIGEAAQAGKHIFCEKPIDHDLAKIDSALDVVQMAGVKLQIGFNRRFDPNFHRVYELVREGKIGVPHLLKITSRDPAPPPIAYIRVSGGIFLDMTIHDFDMARFLIGSEVTEVFTAGSVLVDTLIGEAGDIDTAVITLRFASGAIGVIDNSRRAVYGYDQRVEVFGSKGMLSVTNNTPDNVAFSGSEGVISAKPLYFFLERYTTAFMEEMRQFVACLKENSSPLVSGSDGRAPVVIGLAARKSFEENRPVKICEIGR